MSKTAFTIVELLLSVAILIMLFSLLSPLSNTVTASAREQAAVANLRTIRLAAFVYQNDYEAAEDFRTLPPYHVVYSTYLGVGQKLFQSPCGYRAIVPNELELSVQYMDFESPDTIEYVDKYGGAAAVFTDATCNPSRAHWESELTTKTGLAATLDGGILRLRKRGLTLLSDWWSR